MIAKTQYKMTAADLEIVLAIIRAGTLNEAGKRLGVDGSTVFRSVKRIEKGLGQKLFARSRNGSKPTKLAHQLAQHAKHIETELETALAVSSQDQGEFISGTVKLATTDTVLHGFILPVLADISTVQPQIKFDITTSNTISSLSMHDADIALRVTRQPPEHLIGKYVGRIQVAVFGPKSDDDLHKPRPDLSHCNWIAPDDYLPDHQSVAWRKRVYPSVVPHYMVDSIMSVASVIGSGAGVGLIPLYLAQNRDDLVQLSDPIDECETQLWLLIRTESRNIHSVSSVYGYMAKHLKL